MSIALANRQTVEFSECETLSDEDQLREAEQTRDQIAIYRASSGLTLAQASEERIWALILEQDQADFIAAYEADIATGLIKYEKPYNAAA